MLQINHLSKSYIKGKRTLDDISLHVCPGDIYGFIGHNGAGKTTTIKAVVGVMDFDEGEVLIDGASIRQDPIGCKQKIAYIPDNPDLYDYLTGIQYLNFIGDIYGISKADREESIRNYSSQFEITDVLGDLIGSYSHGMRQKLAIISALIHRPKLLVLDEPFVGLDPKAALTLKTIMHEMCREGSAIFFSTHVLDVAEKLCNKIAIIKAGRLVADGDMETLRGDQSLEDVFMEVIDREA